VLQDWATAQQLGLKVPASPDPEDLSRLSNASFESLRSVGDLTSVEALRKARQSPSMSITLRQLSFDVAEEIYWQITGGLSRETFAPTGRPATSERRP